MFNTNYIFKGVVYIYSRKKGKTKYAALVQKNKNYIGDVKVFMEIAIGAIGIGIVLMVGYLVIAEVAAALPATDNVTTAAIDSTQATVFAGFGLLAVGIIVLAAFGLINVFK